MSKANRPGFFELDISPYLQAGVTIGLILFLSIVLILPGKLGLYYLPDYMPWIISSSLTLLYAIGTSVLSLGTKDQNKYWGRSIMGYMAVVAIGGGIAYLFSGLSIFEAKSFSWIYIVFSVGFILFFVMIRAMRRIVEIAEKQDRRLRGEE